MDRRDFLGTAAALGAGISQAATGSLPRRPYKNGIELSVIAFGGIVVCGLDQQESDRRVAAAFERGVNYFDCAPSYFDGEAELKLGRSLRPFRNRVFLAEKTTRRDAAGARVTIGNQHNLVSTAVGYASASSRAVHFGLGPLSVIPRVTIAWPSGKVQTLTAVPANRRLAVTEP